jgi:hypothetical protein
MPSRSAIDMMSTETGEPRNLGGRPPKFGEPSRPVTVTLPESTLEKLKLIDPDRAQAIAKLARMAFREEEEGTGAMAEIVNLAGGAGLVVVGASKALRGIPFVHLVEIGLGRFLLALDRGYDFKSLELSLVDAIPELPEADIRERELINQLLTLIRHARRSLLGHPAEILLVKKDG